MSYNSHSDNSSNKWKVIKINKYSNAFLKTLLVWHRFSVQTAKYSQSLNIPSLNLCAASVCNATYKSQILLSNVGMAFLLHKEVVHMWGLRKTNGGTWPPLSGQPSLQKTCKRHLLVPVHCRAGEYDVTCSTNFCPTFPAGVQGTEARTKNSAK